MKICIIAKRYYTGKDLLEDRYGRLYHLPKQWANLGAEVDVIALDYRGSVPMEVEHGRLKLFSHPSKGLSLRGLLRCFSFEKYDIVVASGHVNIARLGLSITKKYGQPFVFDVYDYYPAFFGKLHFLIRPYFQWQLSRSEAAFVVSQRLQFFCEKSLPSVHLVPNGVEPETFTSLDPEQARSACGLPQGIPIIGLFGSLSVDLGLDDVIAAFRQVRSHRPDMKLVVAGKGGEAIQQVEGVRYLGMLSQSEIVNWASACDCLLIPYRDSLQVRYSQSARLAEYLAMQRPVVVTRVGDAERWFSESYPGWCEPASPKSMGLAIERQLEQSVVQPLPDSLTWSSLGAETFYLLKSLV